jgi:hypothetical protein
MIEAAIRFMMTNFTISFFFAGLVGASWKIWRHRQNLSHGFIAEAFFSYYCFFSLGMCFVYNFVMHVFFHGIAARFIGWSDSPFQLEVGFASLGLGVAGILAIRKELWLRVGIIIISNTFLWGAAGGHLYQLYMNHDEAPGNAGVMLWTGLLQPVISLTLLIWSVQAEKEEVFADPSNYDIYLWRKELASEHR